MRTWFRSVLGLALVVMASGTAWAQNAQIIGVLTGWKLYQDNQEAEALAAIDLTDIGVSEAQAGCGEQQR